MTSARLDAIVTDMSTTIFAPSFEAAENVLVDQLTGLARAYADSQAFVSLLAHELRTRLRVIEQSLVQEGQAEPALESTRSVQGLVEALLGLARGGSGGCGDTQLAIRAVVDDLGAAAVRIGALPVVRLPQILVETILHNLVANALEAAATQVNVYARPDGTICVTDDGLGVPPEKAAQIFEPYSGKFGGAGLGLTLCREILRRRGGEIWLELPSTFCFKGP
jgi:signal transduction histidine kinase